MMPKQVEMELPLLAALEKLGGKAKPQDVYVTVTKSFPALTEADLAEQLQSGGNRWRNRIQWVRQRLVEMGEMESPSFGTWAITAKGLARLRGGPIAGQPRAPESEAAHSTVSPPPLEALTPPSQNFEETVEEYQAAFKARLLQKLHDLSPRKFEEFAGVLLERYGFVNVEITGRSGDGGIDGRGELKLGLAVVRAGFQCKRWQPQVGSPEVQSFRGAIQGQCELGYLFTTSTFSAPAQAESVRKGAVPIILFDGNQIGEIMIEKEIGVRRRQVALYEDQIEGLFEGL
jgi:restriction system protein